MLSGLGDTRIEPLLCAPEALQLLLAALHDAAFEARELAVALLGRLAHCQPPLVLPFLRQTLVQLLTELQYGSEQGAREDSARLLGALITTASALTRPYADSIFTVLWPRLADPAPAVATAAMSAVGALSLVAGDFMRQHVDRLLPLLLSALQSPGGGAASVRKDVCLRALAQLVQSTGCVVQPYLKHPALLPTVLALLKGGEHGGANRSPVHREALRLLGTLGALDPFRAKMSQAAAFARAEAQDVAATAAAAAPRAAPGGGGGGGENDEGGAGGGGGGGGAEDQTQRATPNAPPPALTPSSDDYYPTVAMGALLRILAEKALAQQHSKVVQALMFVCKSLGPVKCAPFLPQIVPAFVAAVRTAAEPAMRGLLLTQLAALVAIVAENIRPFVPELLQLVREYWKDQQLLSTHLLTLVEQVDSFARACVCVCIEE